MRSTEERFDSFVTRCPGWCTGDHGELQFPSDWVHMSPHTTIPVVAAELFDTNLTFSRGEAMQLTALAILGEQDDEPWIVVSSEAHEHLRLTFGSFHRLLARTRSLLRDCGAPEPARPIGGDFMGL